MSIFLKQFIILLAGIFILTGCKKEKSVQAITGTNLYQIPQGNQPYDDTVMAFYKEYGSYLLYKFTQTEFQAGFNKASIDSALQGDPAVVGLAIATFKEYCLNYYPEAFKKATVPFVIMLSSGLYIKNLDSSKFFYEDAACRATDRSLTLGFVNRDLQNAGNVYLNKCIGNMHRYYMSHALLNGRIRVPDAFAKLTPSNVYQVEDFFSIGLLEVDRSLNPVIDFGAYINVITTHTLAEMQSTYFIPSVDKKGLIKKKYDLTVNYFRDSCKIDLQAIGNVHPK